MSNECMSLPPLKPLNLYQVRSCYEPNEYCCYVIEETRGRAKAWAAGEFGEDFCDMRCYTLKKGVNATEPLLIECETDKGYDIVQECGYGYIDEEELAEWLGERLGEYVEENT